MKLSKGAPVMPRQFAHHTSCSCSFASFATTAPPTTSLCPFTYFLPHPPPRSAPRRTARRGPPRSGAHVQFRQRRAEPIGGRVSRTGVVVSALLPEGAESESRTQVSRRNDAAGGVVALEARSHGLCDLPRTRRL